MQLLFFTRKIDAADARVGFVSDWVNALARQVDSLYVLTWQPSRAEGLAKNVHLIQLPANKFVRLLVLPFKLFKILPRVDSVFTHMMPLYAILVGPWSKLFHKKLIHWYTHSSVDWRLKLAAYFVDEFATASSASFNLKTKKKVNVLGHGINVDYFKPAANNQLSNSPVNLISIGRISPSKDYESMLKALSELKASALSPFKLKIVGGAELPAEKSYLNSLQTMTAKMELTPQVEFVGPVKHQEVLVYLRSAHIFINLSQTGSLDKAVLEAMASGLIVLTSNPAFKEILPPQLIVERDQPPQLAQKIKTLINLSVEEQAQLKRELRQIVVSQHSLDSLTKKIIGLCQ